MLVTRQQDVARDCRTLGKNFWDRFFVSGTTIGCAKETLTFRYFLAITDWVKPESIFLTPTLLIGVRQATSVQPACIFRKYLKCFLKSFL